MLAFLENFESVAKFIIRIKCLFTFNKADRKRKRVNLFAEFERNRFLDLMYKKINKQTYFCIGDSHVDIFSQNSYSKKKKLASRLFPTIFMGNLYSAPQFVSYHLDGVLAYSLNRHGSTNQGLEKIEYLIKYGFLPKNCRVVTVFGEPDCRIHVKKEANKQKRSNEEIIEDILENYGSFLINLKQQGFRVYVYSPIASQKGNMRIDPVYKRYVNEKERNTILLKFEEKLKKFCLKNNLVFISLLSQLLNSDLTTKEEFYLPDGVHLNEKGRRLILDTFSKIGEK